MCIGLKRGTVELCDYSEKWADAYEQEKAYLLNLAAPYIDKIAHIGSTSIPGLIAKPIIDIAIEVTSLSNLNALVDLLPEDNYQYFGERNTPGDYFCAKGREDRRTHYLHISVVGTANFPNSICFRNKLRNSPLLRDDYKKLKQTLALHFSMERTKYTRKKSTFIQKVLQENRNR